MGVATALVASTIVTLPAAADTLEAPALGAPVHLADVTINPTFTWAAVPTAAKYRIQVSASPTFSSTAYTADVLGTSATPTAELPLGTLYWHVASIDSTSTVGPYSASRTLTRSQPAAPAVTTPADGHTFVYPSDPPVLRWAAVAGMVSYRVEIDDASDFVGATAYTTESTSFSLPTALPSNSVRFWRVQGVSTTPTVTTAWSSDVDERSFSVTWPYSSRPTLITPSDDLVTPVDDVQFSWAPTPGAASYELEVATDAGFSANVQRLTTYATKYRPLNTLLADQYYWHVRAVDPSGNYTDWSDVSAFNRVWLDELAREARPTISLDDTDAGTAGVQLEADRLAIRWTPIPRANYYQFEISTDPTFISNDTAIRRTCTTPHTTWTPLLVGDYTETSGFAACAWAGTSTTAATTQFLKVGDGPYYVRVRGVDKTPANGTIFSSWSNAATPDRPAPAASVFSVVSPTVATTTPTEPAVPLSSPDSADTPLLTWKPVDGAAAYLVFLARDSSFNTAVVTGGGGDYVVTSQTQLVLPDVLLDNTVGEPYYWFALPCSRWDGVNNPNNTCSVGPEQAINIDGYNASFNKRGLSVSGVSGGGTQTDTVATRWNDQLATSPGGGGLKWYEVQVLNSSNVVIDQEFTDATGWTPIKTAYPDGPYTWRSRVIDAANQPLAWSESVSFVKSSSAPTSPTTSGANLRLPVLTWDATSFAKSYQVEIYRGTDPTYPSGSKEGSTLTTAYPVATPADALSAGVYSWRVRQVDTAGNTGPWTAGSPNFTVGASAPVATTPAQAAGVPTSSLVFGWSSVADSVRYRLQTSTSSGFGTMYEDVPTVGTAYAPVKAYVGGTTYYWRVIVLNSDGDLVATSDTRNFVAQTAPTAPTASASVVGTTVTIAYSSAGNGGSMLTGYSVRYRVVGAPSWTYVDRGADTASVALLGLATSTKYEAQVAALNAVGTSDWSPLVSATTATTPAAPTSLRVTPGVGSLAISWAKPADGGSPITGYVVSYTPAGGSTTTSTTTSTTLTLTGLTPGVSYSVAVAAVNAVGMGNYATAVSGTPTSGTTPTPTPTPTATPTPTPTATATTVSIGGGKTILYGSGATLTGSLKTSSGTAIANKTVTVQVRPVGGTAWSKGTTATTTSSGDWTAVVQPSKNREFRASFAASAPYAASVSATTTVLVKPKITRMLSDTTVKLGAKVTFSGKVRPAHKGKAVQLQRKQGKKWVTKKRATTSATSTYRFAWKTDSKTDYRWRVVLPKHGDHAKTMSAKILLTVR